MTDDNSDSWSVRLNRRNVLGALGTVGAASALGGAGTMAWLNDTESFDGNVITAGELDLRVAYRTWYNGELVEGMMGVRNGGTSAVGTLGDVKPGDWGTFKFCPRSHTNPAFLWLCGMLTANDENGQNEPERNHSDDTTTGAGNGELADAIRAKLAYCAPESGEVEGTGRDGRREIASGSLRHVLSVLDNGVPLDGTGDGSAGVDRVPFPGSDGEHAPPCVCLKWKLPKSVGNEVQSDTLTFDLSFYAEQARHNDGSTNPCVTSTTGDEGEWGKLQEFEDDEASFFARVRYGQGGTSGDGEVYLGDTPADRTQGQRSWSSSTSTITGSFSLSYDASAGEATFDVSGGSAITYDVNDPGSTGDGSADELAVQVKAYDADQSAAVSNVRLNGSEPTGPDAVSVSGSRNYLHVGDLDTTVDWTLSGDFEMEPGSSPARESPAVGIHVD